MKHCITFLITWLFVQIVFGQIKSQPSPALNGDRMTLVSSLSGRITNQNRLRNIKPVYEHKGNTLSADSGELYEDEIGRQFFEAFGNIVITQPSGSIIHAERLHYDAAMQHAILTKNVRMIDGDATLTTNYLTYNMRNKVGTYTGGGRIINRGDTITSKNAYYFEVTKDAYFRNKVVVRTPDVKIYTDTMRYNSLEKVTYFFGPTNINGKDGDKLYTELGNYNTSLDIAQFSKNNLYTQGTKFLKGDSLYYERNGGFGEAFRNVVFVDTLDKFYANGGYGLYKQVEESILMTDKPLVTYVVLQDDTTKNDIKQDSIPQEDDKPLSRKEKKKLEKEAEKQLEITNLETRDSTFITPPPPAAPKIDSVYMTADTLFSRVILVKDYKPLDLKLNRDGGAIIDETEIDYGDDENDSTVDSLQNNAIDHLQSLNRDSLAIDSLGIDSIGIDSLQLNDLKSISDSISSKLPLIKKVVEKVEPAQAKKVKTIITSTKKELTVEQTTKADSVLRNTAIFPTGLEADSLLSQAITSVQSPDTTTKDSSKVMYSDTARTRIVNAYHNVRLFKSDLQAVADSVYYGMVDSMFRFMGRPMIWAEGSQMSADTIFMQIQSQKLDNALLKNNAFMVNVVLDTVKFNQLKGRKITAFFANNNIETIFVDGNAENLVFTANDSLRLINEMFHDRSSRFKIKMKDKKIVDYVSSVKVEQRIYPFKLVSSENEILPGFIWRPQDRPSSKEDLLNRKREVSLPVSSEDKASENPGKRTLQDEVVDKLLNNKNTIQKPSQQAKPLQRK